MNTIRHYNFPTSIYVGAGALAELPALLRESGAKRVCLVTDKMLLDLDPVAQLSTTLKDAAIPFSVFSEISGNPVKAQVVAGVDAYKEGACDAIVAIGGGAVLDVAKAIALMVNHPGDLFNYIDGDPDAFPVNQQQVPFLVALPTTAGTGSEVGRSAVISDDVTHAKKIIFDPSLLPPVVIADAELTLGLPPHVTAATGIDALTHAIEAYLAPGTHPMCDGIALQSIKLVAQSLDTAVLGAKGDDSVSYAQHLDARDAMLDAAMMGAIAFQKGLGVIHSLAHALSAVCGMHHGLACAIVLPYGLLFNKDVAGERYAAMAYAAGLPHEQQNADGFIAWVIAMNKRLDIPQNLIAADISPLNADQIHTFAMADGCKETNPKQILAADMTVLLDALFAITPLR